MLTFSDPALLRILRSLLAAELAAGGRRIAPDEAASWPDILDLGPEGLGLDSLELLRCAAAVNQLFHLHETGIEDHLLAHRRLDQWAAIIRHGLAEGTSGLTFATSGSTGAPKPCPHPAATLLAETDAWEARYRGVARVLQAVPSHHIYGCLFTALLPDRLAVPVLDIRPLAPGALAREWRGGDLLVGHPAGLAALLRTLPALPPGLRVVSSSAALPAATHAALCAAGAAEVTEIYGSSETAGIGWRTVPDAAFTLLPRWRPGAAGDVASVIEAASGAEIPLPDRVAWEGATLRLLGRKDQAVQVGGVNVYPAQVAARLAEHPLVAECAVRLDMALPEPRLKAFVVPRPGSDPAEVAAALERWCAARCSAAERPVRIDCGPAVPRTETGKPADWSHAA